MLKHFSKTPRSFKTQLLWLITTFSVILVLANSLITSYFIAQELKEELEGQSQQLVKTFSEQSILALLYDSKANAALPLSNMLHYPNIVCAAIYKSDMSLLDYSGDAQTLLTENFDHHQLSYSSLVEETHSHWVYAVAVTSAEVILDDEKIDIYNMEHTQSSKPDELLGYVSITISKDKLKQAQRTIVIDNFISSAIILMVFIICSHMIIRRLTTPLSNLANTMRNARDLPSAQKVLLQGPLEVNQIAHIYNQMIEKLSEQDLRLRTNRDQLESEVALRTQELVQARDAALTASRHKSEFLANISHELRTPIQAIIGYTDLVKEELEMQGFEEFANDLQHVLERSDSLLNLINNILDVTKVEAGKMELKIESSSLAAIAHDIKETLAPLMQKNGNTFIVECNGSPNFIDIDHTKIFQIMLNLLSNANKFTQQGEIKLTVSWCATKLHFEVADNGIGIAPENQQNIFNEFQQIDGSLTRKYQGTGLGLTICKRFTELMGGHISVESQLGQGATFLVTIPLPLQSHHPSH